MINQSTVDTILLEIKQLEKEYNDCPGMILTEDDLKCQLFSLIKNKVPMKTPTINSGVDGSSLHSEVKFFDEDENLTLIPDLCIIDPTHMSVFHSVEFEVKRKTAKFKKYSSKNFEVGGSAILIELKFCRKHTGIDDADILKYKEDLNKMIRLNGIINNRSQGRDEIYGIFVVFNKTNIGNEKYEHLKTEYHDSQFLSMFYGTGNLSFEGINPNIYGSGYLTEDNSIC
jgi:hypothetical protein